MIFEYEDGSPFTQETIDRARAAETIALPKNRNRESATRWLQEIGLDVPDFPGRKVRESEGRTYRLLKDSEIIADTESKEADIGFLGSDKWIEIDCAWWRMRIDWIGQIAGCEFVLAAQPDNISDIEARLENGEQVTAVTSNMSWLTRIARNNEWHLYMRNVSGSVEAYGDRFDMVADLRITGATLEENGLEEFKKLGAVDLGVLYRSETSEHNPGKYVERSSYMPSRY